MSGLTRILIIQAALSAIAIMCAPAIVEVSGLHFEQIGIFRIGVVGVLFHFVFLACTTLLLYFERYAPYFVLQAMFTGLMIVGTGITIALGESYLGLGYLAATAIAGAAAFAVLDRTLDNICYVTFMASVSRSGLQVPRSGKRRLRFRALSNACSWASVALRARLLSARSGVVLVACVLAPCAVGISAAHAASQPSVLGQAVPEQADATVIERGDRIRIRIMQQLDADTAGGSGAAPAMPVKTFFDRTDLSDDYEVQSDGSVAIPRLGAVPAYGRSVADVRSAVSRAFTETMGSACDVAVSIIDRAPIYVSGPVRSPGSFKYVTGMLVIHAVALAGGLESLQDRRSRVIDELRERERLASEKSRLARLIAQKTNAEAELRGAPSAAVPPELVELAGKENADELMAIENRKLALSLKLHGSKLDALKKAEADAARDMTILNERNDQLKKLVTTRTKRVAEIEAMSERGFAAKPMLLAANSEAVDAETRLQEGVLGAVQATQKYAEAVRAVEAYTLDRAVALELQVAKLEEEIHGAKTTVASLETVVRTMKAGLVASQTLTDQPTFDIIRMGPDGTQQIRGEEMTTLRPGDLVRINSAPTVIGAEAEAVHGPGSALTK